MDGNGLASGPVISIPYNTGTNQGYSGLVIDGLTIRRGTATSGYSAGIRTYSVGLTISRCIVENNTNSNTSSGLAGGIYAGAMLNELSSRVLRIDSCIIRNNSAPLAGGITIDAIAGFQFVLVNTLIYGNQSTNTDWLFGVGGVAIGTGSQMMADPPNNPKIINCTIANNTALHPSVKVGGVGVNLDFGQTVTIANSIVWHASYDDLLGYNGETLTISYSDIEDAGDTGTGVIHSNPSFVSGSDYHLDTGSPCIDTGSNSVSGIPSTDLEGNPRISDGDGNGTATVDMGAYENAAPETPPPIVDFDGDLKTDIAVYHSASGLWFIKPSSGAADYYVGYGGTGYEPVNLVYLYGYVY